MLRTDTLSFNIRNEVLLRNTKHLSTQETHKMDPSLAAGNSIDMHMFDPIFDITLLLLLTTASFSILYNHAYLKSRISYNFTHLPERIFSHKPLII